MQASSSNASILPAAGMECRTMAAEGTRVRRVAVLGGGISGLAAGFRLKELAAAHEMALEVALFEADSRLGCALHTVRRDGFTIEAGADSFLSEKPAALNLVERLGMTHELIQTQERFRKTYVVRQGRLVEIPAGFSLLAPALLRPVFASPLFSLAGKLRIALEPLIPRRREDSDESLGAFVRRRLGDEALRRLAQPLAGGIYTADPEQLSVRATMPRFVEMERRYGSLIKGLRAAARSRQAGGETRGISGARWSLFLSFRAGMGALVERLAARLDGAIHTARISALEATNDSAGMPGWTVKLDHGAAYAADAIVCALPAHAAAPLLKPACPALGAALGQIGYASAATVNLAWDLADFPHPPASFGFVVPIIEGRRIIAGSFSSFKFAQRAPEGIVLARVFIGGALQAGLMRLDDDAMTAAAREEFSALTGVRGAPLLTYVRRWPHAMPQYAVGHPRRAATIETEAAAVRYFALAGAFIRGVGIPDCIASGERAAQAVFTQLTGASC